MSQPRGGPAAIFGLSIVTALTTWATLFSWRGFSDESSSYLLPLFATTMAICLVGGLLRWARAHPAVIVAVQLLFGALVVLAAYGGSIVPTRETLDAVAQTFADSIEAANRYAAPVPYAVASLQAPLVTAGMACALVVDLIACSLRRVPLAGLPLLTIYSIPVSLLGGGVGWWVFAASAAGFLVMLFLQEDEELTRWGRPLATAPDTDPSGFGVRTGSSRSMAVKVGTAATALGVFLPIVIPTLSLSLFDGSGPGGDGSVTIENPVTDLRRDLTQVQDVPLLRVTTDDPTPGYLRIGALTIFNGTEWRPGNRNLDQVARGDVPLPDGLSPTLPTTQHQYSVTVYDTFTSTWLPIQTPLAAVQAGDDWHYDVDAMDILSDDEDVTTAGLDYTFTSMDVEYDQELLLQSYSGETQPDDYYVDLPDDVPVEIRDLARELTSKAPTKFQAAVILQDWFHEDGGFTYDLTVQPGNGSDALTDFLRDKSGYCEQFSAAMAILARAINIPARVVVGFLQPDDLGDGTYEYSTHDLHAWPELYFPGSGWVRFEPTPDARASTVPAYTQDLPRVDIDPSVPVQPSVTENPRNTVAPGPEAPSSAAPDAGPGAGDAGGVPWAVVLLALGGALLVTVLALVPRVLRRARRERRWRDPGGAEAAWAELRDVLLDHRLPWPAGQSPRAVAREIVEHFAAPAGPDPVERPQRGPGVNPEADEALTRLTLAVERLRYSRRGETAETAELRADVETCTASVSGGVTPRVRRSAAWWPRSVFRPRRSAPPGVDTGDADDRELVDQVRR